jgi:hypothetical protein
MLAVLARARDWVTHNEKLCAQQARRWGEWEQSTSNVGKIYFQMTAVDVASTRVLFRSSPIFWAVAVDTVEHVCSSGNSLCYLPDG